MKLAILYSGGKDSTFTIYKALKEGNQVRYLVSLISKNPASYMFHYPNINLTKVQAGCMEIPIITKKTKGEKEKELEDIKNVLKKIRDEIDGVGAGALASKYQYDRVSNICKEMGLRAYTPCWMQDQEEHIKEILNAGFEVIFTGVAAGGLGKEWLGRKLDWQAFEDLKKIKEKYNIHIGGEGGEYESLVLDCPLYKKKIEVKKSHEVWDDKTQSGHLVIEDIKLSEK